LKIALTADLHLTTLARNPERFLALERMLKQCQETKIKLLIIAGDLFDQSLSNYAEFERLYKTHRPADLKTIIIPGNHDQRLSSASLVGEGLIIHTRPVLLPLNKDWKMLLVPYQPDKTMGETIAPFAADLETSRWILISHGDWSPGLKTRDPYETGVYMPLARSDLDRYQPDLVLLGHIHLPFDDAIVHYPGSPCPINISETGLRRFLILDTERGELIPQIIDSPLLYFDEKFVCLPEDTGLDLLQKEMRERITGWDLPPGWEKRVQVRLEIAGFAPDRDELIRLTRQTFKPFSFFKQGEPILDHLYHIPDPDRAEITKQFRIWLESQEWPADPLSPSRECVLEEALKLVYGVG
jgi:exonuclease SbcD